MGATLVTLPGEIRNQIYNYLLILPKPSTHRTLGDPPLHASILRTCRKLHEEGLQILYGSNTYLAHVSLLTSLPKLRIYYASVQKSHLISMITKWHVRVRLDNDPSFTKEQATKAFSGMEEVTIEVMQSQYGGSDYRALKLFEDVRDVKCARIYGSTTFFPQYVKWLEECMMSTPSSTLPFDEVR